jgi:hypothetical protein
MGDAASCVQELLVDAEEDVCRLCFSAKIPISIDNRHPNQIDVNTGYILLEELSWQDFKKRGFSLQRRRLYSHAEALALAAKRNAAKAEKGQDAAYQLAGVLIAKVASINAISDDDGSQIFRVLATPNENEPGHSEIRIADHLTKMHLLKYRVSLQSALGKMQDAALLDRT